MLRKNNFWVIFFCFFNIIIGVIYIKQIIGVVEWPYNDIDGDNIYEINREIINKIVECGGIPIGIFPSSDLSIVDGIIKPGAYKIYESDRNIYNYCVENDIPYLGICCGMQLMTNNSFKKVMNHKNSFHYINIEKNTLLHDILNTDRIMVNSKHNYCITNLDGFIPCAYADDGVIEAIYKKDNKFILGVQWHPELENNEFSSKIFTKFIENAKK